MHRKAEICTDSSDMLGHASGVNQETKRAKRERSCTSRRERGRTAISWKKRKGAGYLSPISWRNGKRRATRETRVQYMRVRENGADRKEKRNREREREREREKRGERKTEGELSCSCKCTVPQDMLGGHACRREDLRSSLAVSVYKSSGSGRD
jgi:hypothetical protein